MDCTGEITLPEGTEMVMPGDNVTITVELIYPVALNPGLRFAIREGGRTVGAGQITRYPYLNQQNPLFLPIIAYTLSNNKIRDKGKIVSAGY